MNVAKLSAIRLISAAALFLPVATQAQVADGNKPNVKIKFVYTLSTTSFPLSYAIEQGFFKKRGIDVEPVQLADFQAVYTADRAGAADMGSGGLASIVNLRGNGVPIKVVWGTSLMANDILVKTGADIKEIKQLRGKDIGVFGGASGTTANMLIGVLIDQFGFDPRKDAQLKYGAPTLQANMLVRGDLAAFVSSDPITAIELAGNRVVTIGELGEIYGKHSGGYVPHAGALTVSDRFAQQNPEAVNKFLGGWLEAVSALQKTPSLWQPLLNKQLKIDDPKVADLLMQRTAHLWPTEWTKRNVEGEIEALKYMNKNAGKGFLDKLPDDAFSMEFSPR